MWIERQPTAILQPMHMLQSNPPTLQKFRTHRLRTDYIQPVMKTKYSLESKQINDYGYHIL